MFRVVSGTLSLESPSSSPSSSSPEIFSRAEGFYRQVNADLRENYRHSQDPEYLGHFTRSSEQILKAAKDYEGKPLCGTVVILGSGNGNDLPPELIHQFDKVILVEIDRVASEILLGKISRSLQKKVTVVEADLTSCLVEFIKRFQIILKGSLTSKDFINRFNFLCDEMVAYLSKKKESPIKLEEPASFVVSSGVVTQLHQQLLAMFSELYSKRFFEEFPFEATDSSFLVVKSKMEENHLSLMRSLIKEDSRAYIADINEEVRVYPRLTSNFSSDVTLQSHVACSHLTPKFISSVTAHFSVASQTTWDFRLSEPSRAKLVRSPTSPTFVESIKFYPGTTGRVLALTLVPKKA
jgi:hypothetical protein